jgi:peptidyl-prolyl cis-trans isomerase B (cyclophilin B)
MGRERQARLARQEVRAELAAESTWRRRVTIPIILFVFFGVGLAIQLYVRNSGEVNPPAFKPTTAVIKTDKGDITLELYRADAPKTVDNFIKLANEGFYVGTTFHRVIADFMIQGGDPNSKDDDPSNDGQGGPGYAFEDEINARSLGLTAEEVSALESEGYAYDTNLSSHKMEKGALAMANSGPNTNGSQFFIVTTKAQPHLDGRHTVFGMVTEGLDIANSIAQGDVIREIQILEPGV